MNEDYRTLLMFRHSSPPHSSRTARRPYPGGLPYKSDGDARRLILGCKLQILVSLRVSLSTLHKEIYKKKCPVSDHTESSLRGQFKLEPHPHWTPLGV